MKKFSIFLPVLMASFFLLLPNVRAEEITINITDDMFSKLTNFESYIDTANSFCINNNNISCDYFIRYHDDYSYPNSYFLINNSSSSPKVYLDGGKLRANNATQKFVFDSPTSLNTTSSFYNSSDWQMFQYDSGSIRLFLYSSFDLPFRTIDNNTYIFTDGINSYSVVNDGSNYCPTLYDLYNEWHSAPPTPPDNTPILTNFYSVAGSKIGWLGEQIVSNYIYLSIIGVFILIFLIEFIRRYFL